MQKFNRSPVPSSKATALFVVTQLVLVVIASAGMSRCSPLAPSEQLGAAAAPPAPLAAGGANPAVAGDAAAAAERSRQELALQLNSVRSTLITQSVVTETETPPLAAANSVALILSEAQINSLFQGTVIDVSIIESLKNQGLSDDAARAQFLAIRAIPDTQIQITLIAYILKSRNIAPRINAGSFTLAISDTDGLIRIHALPDLVKHGIRQGYRVLLEIRQK